VRHSTKKIAPAEGIEMAARHSTMKCAGRMELISTRRSNQSRWQNVINCGAAFNESRQPNGLFQRGIQINRAGRMGLIAAQHLSQSRRPNEISCGTAFESIAPAE
jgi:hypothetical protein